MPTWRVAYDCRIVCIHAYSTTHWRAVDKIGRRTSMLCFGSLAAIFTFLFSQHCKTFPRLMPLLVWCVCPADREFLYFNQWNTEG